VTNCTVFNFVSHEVRFNINEGTVYVVTLSLWATLILTTKVSLYGILSIACTDIASYTSIFLICRNNRFVIKQSWQVVSFAVSSVVNVGLRDRDQSSIS